MTTGASTVLIGNQPAARVTDTLVCCGPPDKVKKGSSTVIILNQEAARIGDPTEHGGVVVTGFATVLIGTTAQASVMQQAAKSGTPFCEECARLKAAADAAKKAAADAAKKKARTHHPTAHRKRPPHASKRAPAKAPAKPGAIPSAATGGAQLGSLSAKYESGGRGPGTIAHNAGDAGGASYGTYQIATKTGTMRDFESYLGQHNPDYAQALQGSTPGTPAFDRAWKGLAQSDPQGFEQAQHDFIQATHYDPAQRNIERAVPGLDFDQRSGAVRDVLWSTSVQNGSGGATNVFRRALAGTDPSTLSDQEIIQRVYAERGADNGEKYFSHSSPAVRQSVERRFQSEQRDALQMLSSGHGG